MEILRNGKGVGKMADEGDEALSALGGALIVPGVNDRGVSFGLRA